MKTDAATPERGSVDNTQGEAENTSSPLLAKGGVQNYSLAKERVHNCSLPTLGIKGVIHII